MLKTLLKKQMAEIFRNYFYDPKKNKMRSKGATIAYIALYALLMVGLLGGIFALMAVGLCGPLVEAGMDWLYYLLIGLIAVLLGTFGSVFSTYSSLYLSKDNDLLLSMPIPVRCVMASRLLGVYLLGLMYAAVVIVPGVIVYWITAPVTAGAIVGGVLMVLLVSVIVMVLSCLLGWVVARISLKLKNKSFITVILSLLFLAAYYFVYYRAQALITLLVENAAVYGMKIRGSAYLLYLFGCVGAGDWLAMLIVTVTQALLLALTMWGIARSFLKIATATGSVKKVRFEHKAVRAQSTQRALFGKELRRFTASPNYMLNCGLGILMLPVAGIALLIKGRARARAQAAEPDMDQRDHAHQAGRQRDARALCQLVLCHCARRAVLSVRQIFERGGISRARCCHHGGRLRAAATLGETARHAHLRRALIGQKPHLFLTNRCVFLLCVSVTARARALRTRAP